MKLSKIVNGGAAINVGPAMTEILVQKPGGKLNILEIVSTQDYDNLSDLLLGCYTIIRCELKAKHPDFVGICYPEPVDRYTGAVRLTTVFSAAHTFTTEDTTFLLGTKVTHANNVEAAARPLAKPKELQAEALNEHGAPQPPDDSTLRHSLIHLDTTVGSAVFVQEEGAPRGIVLPSRDAYNTSPLMRVPHEELLSSEFGFMTLINQTLRQWRGTHLPKRLKPAYHSLRGLDQVVIAMAIEEPNNSFVKILQDIYGKWLGTYLAEHQRAHQPSAMYFTGRVGKEADFLRTVISTQEFQKAFIGTHDDNSQSEVRRTMPMVALLDPHLTIKGMYDTAVHRLVQAA